MAESKEVQELLETYINNPTTLDHALDFAKQLHTRQQYKLSVKVCEAAQERLRTFKGLREKHEDRLRRISSHRRELNEKAAEKAKVGEGLSSEELEKLAQYTLEEAIINNYPKDISLGLDHLNKLNISFAKELISATLDLKESKISKKEKFNETELDAYIFESVAVCSSQMFSASAVMELADLLENAKKCTLTLQVGKEAAAAIQREREEADSKEKQDELDNLASTSFKRMLNSIINTELDYDDKTRKKVILSENAMKEYKSLENGSTLQDTLAIWVPNIVQNPSRIISAAEFLLEKKKFQYVLQVAPNVGLRLEEIERIRTEREEVTKLLAPVKREYDRLKFEKKPIPKPLEKEYFDLEDRLRLANNTPSFTRLSSAECAAMRLQVDKIAITALLSMENESKGEVEAYLDKIIATIEDPNHIVELGQHLQTKKQTDFVIKFGERAQKLIQAVEHKREVRAPLVKELEQLSQEEIMLNSAAKELPAEKQTRKRELQDKISKLEPWPKFAVLTDYHQYDQLNLNVVKTMISAVLDRKEFIVNKKNVTTEEKEAVEKQISELVQVCLQKFSDPSYLLKFAEHMCARKEKDIVLQVVAKCFQQITDIEARRVDRLKVTKQINALKDEEAKLKQKKKGLSDAKAEKLQKLEQQLADLPSWPHFAKLEDRQEFYEILFKCAQSALRVATGAKSELELQIRKKRFDNPKAANEKLEDEQRAKAQQQLDEVCAEVLKHVVIPVNLLKLAQEFETLDSGLTLKLAEACFSKIAELEELGHKVDKEEILRDVLQEEKQELGYIKKDLQEDELELLAKTEAALLELQEQVPPYMQDSDANDDYINDCAATLVDSVFGAKSSLRSKVASRDVDKHFADVIMEKIEPAEIEKCIELCLVNVRSPLAVIDLCNNLSARKEHTQVATLGNKGLELLDDLKIQQAEKKNDTKQRLAIREERQQLEKLRRKLSPESVAKLRALEVQDRLKAMLPKKYNTDVDYDALTLDTAKILIQAAIDAKKDFENKVAMDDDFPEAEAKEQTKKLGKAIETTVKASMKHIAELTNLIGLADVMYNKKEFVSNGS